MTLARTSSPRVTNRFAAGIRKTLSALGLVSAVVTRHASDPDHVRTRINFLTEIFRDPRLGIFALASANKNTPAPSNFVAHMSKAHLRSLLHAGPVSSVF